MLCGISSSIIYQPALILNSVIYVVSLHIPVLFINI